LRKIVCLLTGLNCTCWYWNFVKRAVNEIAAMGLNCTCWYWNVGHTSLRKPRSCVWIAPAGIETHWGLPGCWVFPKSELHLLVLKRASHFAVPFPLPVWIAPAGIETPQKNPRDNSLGRSELHLLVLKPAFEDQARELGICLNCTCWYWNGANHLLKPVHLLVWIAPAGIETGFCFLHFWGWRKSELHLLVLKLVSICTKSIWSVCLNCTCWYWNSVGCVQLMRPTKVWIAPAGIETSPYLSYQYSMSMSELHLLVLKRYFGVEVHNIPKKVWIAPAGIETLFCCFFCCC